MLGQQLGAVELGLEQERGEVVLRFGEMLVDTGLEVRVELTLVDLRLTLLGRRVDIFEDQPDEPAEHVGIRLREAEHADDDAQRNVLRVLDGGVDHVLARGRVEQLLAQRARERLERGDRLRRERGQEQPPRHRVERRIGCDRGRDADRSRQVIVAGSQLADDDRPRREVLRVVRDLGDVIVPYR